ncbi:MAG: hypothetical protein HFI99_07370 [Lachnospiraceae bacterium]|jgi:hypothetical protein|nr:hypothetical protein [Lachnospiraceae bacterium]MCI9325443.1 hypothetical protein [Lachnospiraceae bacterium]
MKKQTINIVLLLAAVLIMSASIWGPELLADYKDRTVLDKITAQISGTEGAGYRYALSANEKLFILSKCLNGQSLPESEQSALTREPKEDAAGYQELEGTYAFVVNHRGPTGKEITNEEIFSTCNGMLSALKEMEILPETLKEVDGKGYEAVLYSAIDVLEPRNNVAVWKVSFSMNKRNVDRSNCLIDAYLDADDGKIYEFYARTDRKWEDIDADEMIEKWSQYMGLESPEPYETDNPLSEATPHYKKYMFSGPDGERTIVTIGFYEGINELFLKISK